MSDPTPPTRPIFNPLAQRSWTDLGPRAISGAVLVVVALIALYVGSFLFSAVLGLVFAGCYREWERMITLRPLSSLGWTLIVLVAASGILYPAAGAWGSLAPLAAASLGALFGQPEHRLWRIVGIAFFGLVGMAMLEIRGPALWLAIGAPDTGFLASLFLGAVIWVTDIGAYFTGRQVGGEKLAPGISPGKTWSGAIGGLAAGTLAGLVVWLIVAGGSPWWIGLLLAAGLSIVGQVGDLVESAVKRHFRIKDSGDIIPGHGGLMDRLDSLTFGVIFLFAVGFIHGNLESVASGILVWS